MRIAEEQNGHAAGRRRCKNPPCPKVRTSRDPDDIKSPICHPRQRVRKRTAEKLMSISLQKRQIPFVRDAESWIERVTNPRIGRIEDRQIDVRPRCKTLEQGSVVLDRMRKKGAKPD